MLHLLSVAGNPNVGVHVRATEAHLFVPPQLSPRARAEAEAALSVTAHALTVGGTTLVGSLLAGNRHGLVIANFVTDRELAALGRLGLPVARLEHPLNAAGNNLLVTDRGALCHPDYDEETRRLLEDALGVPVQPGTLAGLGNVGMAGVATARGVLVHPKSTPEEREAARRVLGGDVMLGTINHGTGLIGAGLVANAHGALIGDASTTIEITRIEDALGLLPETPPRP